MDFGEQMMQLMLVIVGLLVALGGVTAWSRHKKSSGGSQANQEQPAQVDDTADEMAEGSGRSGMTASEHRHSDRADRFDLTGKNAEAAAKVLKRMLQQDNQKHS